MAAASTKSFRRRSRSASFHAFLSFLDKRLSSSGRRDLLRSSCPMAPWNPWATNVGWYWMLYNASAGSSAPLVGMYAGRASTALGAGCSGAAPYGEPNDGTGAQAGGIGFQANRWCGTPNTSYPRVRTFWAIYVGTKGADLGDPRTIQNIHRQMNLQAGINLNKVYQATTGNFPDPPNGYQPMYMDSAGITQYIQKIQTDNSFYNSLVQFRSPYHTSAGHVEKH